MELVSGDIRLRPFRLSDADKMAEMANNKKISRNLRDGFPHPYTYDDALTFIRHCLDMPRDTFFAIEYKGEHVGNISLSPCQDVYRKSAEIGYFIAEPFWNKGIASAAVKIIVQFGFNNLGIMRIQTGVYEYNPASQRVLEKCGFLKEGIFKKAIYKDGGLWDEVRYALLNPEIE
jgi:[ribosomal protein S5]-alanine N-acetyltransferase